MMSPKEIVLVTSHYYPLGPPTDPTMTIDRLLHPVAASIDSCREARIRQEQRGCPFVWRKETPVITREDRGSAIHLHPRSGREIIACIWRLWAAWE